MEEITFEDVVTHYQLKLKEVYDELETLKNQVKKTEICIESGWKGVSADACRNKIETVNGELVKAQAELSEALVKLSAISELLSEGV